MAAAMVSAALVTARRAQTASNLTILRSHFAFDDALSPPLHIDLVSTILSPVLPPTNPCVCSLRDTADGYLARHIMISVVVDAGTLHGVLFVVEPPSSILL